ncbi:MAG TPA: Asp-tRNA(Asn)/Glu-tRNA(Gln) amidotransferase GatCAB subunit B, partial [Polaromonas sp.]|nr:Asp-tRNA(Asn)/Glu-tRNA(Gln) amidotransferase GatCAB subunit B [Polaromonas sp.]
RAMRTKEDAADYRYFPDPDLPPLVIGRDWVEKTRAEMSELPRVMAERFTQDYHLSDYDSTTLTQSKGRARFFEEALAAVRVGNPAKASDDFYAKQIANWVLGELAKKLNTDGLDENRSCVSPTQLGKILSEVMLGTISNSAAKQVLDALWTGDGTDVEAIIEAKGLKQMNDTGELEKIIDDVLAANAKNVEEVKAGNAKAMNALVGQAMKATKGKANPAQVNELLKKKLG